MSSIKIRNLPDASNVQADKDYIAIAQESPKATRRLKLNQIPGLGEGGANVHVGTTPLANPTNGDMWFDDVEAELYVYVQSINGWVQTNGGGSGGGGSTPPPTTTGDCYMLDKPTVLHARGAVSSSGWPSYLSAQVKVDQGTIQAGVTAGIPTGTTEVQLYAVLNENFQSAAGFSVKHTGHNHYKYILQYFNDHGHYPSINGTWYPLDSTGKLMWRYEGAAFTHLSLLEIQGYRK